MSLAGLDTKYISALLGHSRSSFTDDTEVEHHATHVTVLRYTTPAAVMVPVGPDPKL
jgi:hypothetical protein